MLSFLRIKWQYLAVLFAGILVGVYLAISMPGQSAQAKVVTINSRGLSFQLVTFSQDVSDLLLEQGLPVERALVTPSPDTKLQSGMHLSYSGPIPVTLSDGGQNKKVVTAGRTVADVLHENDVVLNSKDEIAPAVTAEISSGLVIRITRVEETELTVNEPIDFATDIQGDPELLYGKESIVRPGEPGKAVVTYRLRLKNGREVSRKKLAEQVLQVPVSEILRVGRKIVVESLEEGLASWYAYKKCLCAAHPYYPKGSYLRVTNLNKGQSLIVRVNDWGPDQAVHAQRVIDLDAEAFKLLAPLSLGTIPIRVEKLKTE